VINPDSIEKTYVIKKNQQFFYFLVKTLAMLLHSIHSIHPPPPLASGGYDLEMGTNTTKILKYMENSDQKMID
jgi:hypothetical protein